MHFELDSEKNIKKSARLKILGPLANAPPKKDATDKLTGELGEACREARALYRDGKIRSVLRLHRWLQENHDYPYGRDALESFLKAKP